MISYGNRINLAASLLICLSIFSWGNCNRRPASKSNIRVKIDAKLSGSLFLNGTHDTVINNIKIFNSPADCIKLFNCYNIVIQNCRLVFSKGMGINMYNCKNVTIKNCYIENTTTGIYALKSTGIKVLYNQIKDVTGPFPKGQMVQFDKVYGGGNCVNYNRCINIAGKSNAEDAISIYKTNGTDAEPVQITGNQIYGGGPSKTGGGIMLGDRGGSYITAKKNILVNPGQYGIAIASGSNIEIKDNIIFSKKQLFSNVGIYVWNQYKSYCSLNTVSGNIVNWTDTKGASNGFWNGGNCGVVVGWNNNNWHANIDSSILQIGFFTK